MKKETSGLYRITLIAIPHFSYRSPPLVAFFGVSKGGGTVENQDPSGACGGLFYLIFSICITFLDQYYRLIMATFKKYIVLFAEIQIGKE